jgi:hypothetical protein
MVCESVNRKQHDETNFVGNVWRLIGLKIIICMLFHN